MDVSYSEPRWRTQTLKERLAHVFMHKLFMDEIPVEFEGTRYQFKAHKNILSHCSMVFEEHFYGKRKNELLKGIDPTGLSYMLSVLYHLAPEEFSSYDNAVIILAYDVAKNLRAPQIATLLKRDILQQIRLSSELPAGYFWKFLDLCRALRLDDITEELLRYSKLHTKRILRDDSFLKVSPGTAIKVLDQEHLDIQEMEVLKSIVRWYESNKAMPFSREILKDMLACVRFLSIQGEEFDEFLVSHWGIVEGRDALKILSYLGNRGTYQLPQWCKSKVRLPPMMEYSSVLKEKYQEQREIPEEVTERDCMNLLNMLTQERFTDVCFFVGPEKVPVKAHRNILAIGSAIFEKMFYGPLKTCDNKIEIDTQHPEGCKTNSGYEDGFRAMIRYFYDDTRLDYLLNDKILVPSTYMASLKYGSGRLRKLCAANSDIGGDKSNLKPSVNTFWKHLEYFLVVGTNDKYKYMTELYLPFASDNVKELFRHQTFLMASKEAVVSVIQLDRLCIREVELLRNVMKWVLHRDRRESFKYDLLKHIRLCDVSLEEFLGVISEDRTFFTSDDSVSICLHLFDTASRLPEWCGSEAPRKRVNYKDGSKSVLKRVTFAPAVRK